MRKIRNIANKALLWNIPISDEAPVMLLTTMHTRRKEDSRQSCAWRQRHRRQLDCFIFK